MSLITQYRKKARIPGNGTLAYTMVGGHLTPVQDNMVNHIQKGYCFNDQVYSVVNVVTDKIRIAPWDVYQETDAQSSKQKYAYETKAMSTEFLTRFEMKKMADLQRKALKPVQNAGKWGELLKYPNAEDNWQELVANGAGYKMLTGNKYLYGETIPGGANAGIPNTICLLPSAWVRIIATNSFPAVKLGYQVLLIMGGTQAYLIDEVMHEKYYNYDFNNNGSDLLGMSPFRAGLRMVTQDNAALDVGTAKMQNGGMESIIYVDDPNADRDIAFAQAKDLKQKLISEWTGADNWGKIGASGYKMGAIKLGLTPVELALIEAQKWDLRRICNLLGGVPSQLLNDPDNRTFNNVKEGEKALTSRCALSHLISFRNSLNRKAQESWGLPKGWIIDFDMSVFSELQETVGESLRWIEPLLKQGWPLNRALEMLNIETLPDKEADEMWIRPDMGQPISEWRINPDPLVQAPQTVSDTTLPATSGGQTGDGTTNENNDATNKTVQKWINYLRTI